MSRHYGDSSIWPCPFFVALISLAKHSPLFCLGLGARLLSELKDVYRQLAFAMCFWTIAHSLPPFARSPPFPSLPRKRLDGPSLEWAKKRDDWPQWLAAIKREVDQLEVRGTWRELDPGEDPGRRPLGTKLVLRGAAGPSRTTAGGGAVSFLSFFFVFPAFLLYFFLPHLMSGLLKFYKKASGPAKSDLSRNVKQPG